MAVKRTDNKVKLVICVESDHGKMKNLTFNRIKAGADDEALLTAGEAIGELQNRTVESIRRCDMFVLNRQA